MNRLSLWLSLVLAAALYDRAVAVEVPQIGYHEDTILAATVHVIRQPGGEQLAVYVAIDNQHIGTITCGGQLLTAIAKDDNKIVNLLVRFDNLRVFPSGAFSYPLVHLVADRLQLPSGYDYVAQEYPTIKVACRGWPSLQYLPQEFCHLSNLEMCSIDKVMYSYMIENYWLGACLC